MTDTNVARLLDEYRIAIADSEDAFKLLAVLYREGKTSATTLAELLSIDKARVKTIATQFYKSKLIKLVGKDVYVLSTRAKEILQAYELPLTAALSKINEVGLPEAESIFLEACAEARAHVHTWLAEGFFANAHHCLGMHLAMHTPMAVQNDETRKEDLARPLWAIVIGLDPDSRRLGADSYCEQVVAFHEVNETPLWKKNRRSLQSNIKVFVKRIDSALVDAQDSENLLIHRIWPENEESKRSTALAALSRLLAVQTHGVPDDLVFLALRDRNDFPDFFLDEVADQYQDVRTQASAVLSQWLPVSEPESGSFQNAIAHAKLKAILSHAQLTLGMDFAETLIASRRLAFYHGGDATVDELTRSILDTSKRIGTMDSGMLRGTGALQLREAVAELARQLELAIGRKRRVP